MVTKSSNMKLKVQHEVSKRSAPGKAGKVIGPRPNHTDMPKAPPGAKGLAGKALAWLLQRAEAVSHIVEL